MRILFAGGGTGGHLYPGLAIARAVQRLDPDARPFFVGARRGIEREVLPASGFPHRLLDLHPLYRTRPWENWRTLVGFAALLAGHRLDCARGATGGRRRHRRIRGGGRAAPGPQRSACRSCCRSRTRLPGISARFIARVATEIYLGFGEAARSLRPRRGTWMEETGNPIEPPPSPRPPRDAARRAWEFPGRRRASC